MSRKCFCHDIDPHVYEVNNDTKINKRKYCTIIWWGLPQPEFYASVDL